jgi:hypothetical protein
MGISHKTDFSFPDNIFILLVSVKITTPGPTGAPGVLGDQRTA